MTADHAALGAGAQLASQHSNHGGREQGFDAGAPTNSLSDSAGPGVLTKISGAPLRAGCNGKPRPRANAIYTAQAGWLKYTDAAGRVGRIPRLVEIKATFGAIECRYDLSATDACCTGCQHRRPAGAPP